MKSIKGAAGGVVKDVAFNGDISIKALRDLLLRGSETASDILHELCKCDNRKAWGYVDITDIEHWLDDSGCAVNAYDALDYMKGNYELIAIDDEIRNVVEILDK